jgi:hypothetical protein
MEEAKAKDTSSVKALAKLEEKVRYTRFISHLTPIGFSQQPDDWSASPKKVNMMLFGHSRVQVESSVCHRSFAFDPLIHFASGS